MPTPLFAFRDPRARSIPQPTIIALLVTTVLAALTFFLAQSLTPWWTEGSKLRIFDFAYHIHLVAQFWFGNITNPYDHDAQRQILSELIGRECHAAMPIGISPSALLLWLPFAALSEQSLKTAHASWLAFSVASAVGAVLIGARSGDGRLPLRRTPILGGALLFACCCSKTFFLTVVLGQTSLVAFALLIFIWLPRHEPDRSPEKSERALPETQPRSLRDGVLLSFLALKPTYLLLGLASLVIQGRFRALLYGIVLIALQTAMVLPRLGSVGVFDFAHTLGIYSSGEIPTYYRDSIVLHTMVTFSSAFGPTLAMVYDGGLGLSFAISRAISTVGLLLPLILVFRQRSETVSRDQRRTAFLAVLATVLLFSPYLGFYEDLLFIAGIGVLIRDGAPFPRLNPRWIIYTQIVWLYFNRNEALQGFPLSLHWLLKAFLLAGLFQLTREGNAKRP